MERAPGHIHGLDALAARTAHGLEVALAEEPVVAHQASEGGKRHISEREGSPGIARIAPALAPLAPLATEGMEGEAQLGPLQRCCNKAVGRRRGVSLPLPLSRAQLRTLEQVVAGPFQLALHFGRAASSERACEPQLGQVGGRGGARAFSLPALHAALEAARPPPPSPAKRAKRAIQGKSSPWRSLRAVRLTMSRTETSPTRSTSARLLASKVRPVSTRSTIRRAKPSPGASSTAPARATTSA